MRYSDKIKRVIFALLCAVICCISFTTVAAYADEREIYLGGFAAGFVLNTTTVEVVGLCDVMTSDGMCSPARDCGIRAGDIVEAINGVEINGKADVSSALAIPGDECEIRIVRGGESLSVRTRAVTDIVSQQKRLGMLVKDSVNGIGTVTFADKTNGIVAALGHPVADCSKRMFTVSGGGIYSCAIYGVKRGVRGTPGELKGSIESNYPIGSATHNCASGVYGKVCEDFDWQKLIKISVADISDVKIGKASIYSTVSQNVTCEYEISIVKVDPLNSENRNFVIKVDDRRLIEQSGGIVQGMSGSPIVQEGRLVGAVTHVFVNDPTRGYGISIDKMLNAY